MAYGLKACSCHPLIYLYVGKYATPFPHHDKQVIMKDYMTLIVYRILSSNLKVLDDLIFFYRE